MESLVGSAGSEYLWNRGNINFKPLPSPIVTSNSNHPQPASFCCTR